MMNPKLRKSFLIALCISISLNLCGCSSYKPSTLDSVNRTGATSGNLHYKIYFKNGTDIIIYPTEITENEIVGYSTKEFADEFLIRVDRENVAKVERHHLSLRKSSGAAAGAYLGMLTGFVSAIIIGIALI